MKKEPSFYPSEYSLEKSEIRVYEEGDTIVINNQGDDTAVSIEKKEAENVALMIQRLIKGIPK